MYNPNMFIQNGKKEAACTSAAASAQDREPLAAKAEEKTKAGIALVPPDPGPAVFYYRCVVSPSQV